MHINIIAILFSGFIATTGMTIVSYALSIAFGRNFKEPEILGMLLNRLFNRLTPFTSHALGWLLHFAVGYIFVTCYSLLWENTAINAGFFNGLWIGFISGLIGIGIWHLVFKLHPNPPVIHLKDYYLALIAAHIVFGAWAALTYFSHW